MIEFQSAHPVRGATARASSFRSPRPDFNPRTSQTPTGSRRFQSTRPVWGATGCTRLRLCSSTEFQSTRPVWGATVRRGDRGDGHPISIHAPRVGRDRFLDYRHKFIRRFQSTRPVWGATAVPAWWQLHTAISIHAPRAGCDAGRRGHLTSRASISIHAPRARCDNVRSVQGGWLPVFQSTHPVRGATMDKAAAAGNNEFQSTRPVWGATMCTSRRRSSATISIHAPRVGRDNCICVDIRVSLHFNPRAPCGARRSLTATLTMLMNFNPRAPCGARPGRRTSCSTRKYFNPRAPCGARHAAADGHDAAR